MISATLETALHRVFNKARRERHETVTVELLLHELLDDTLVYEVLRELKVDMESLRRDLVVKIQEKTKIIPGVGDVDSKPNLEFQKVIQRAIMIVNEDGLPEAEVLCVHVLLAIFRNKRDGVPELHKHNTSGWDVARLLAKMGFVAQTSSDDQSMSRAELLKRLAALRFMALNSNDKEVQMAAAVLDGLSVAIQKGKSAELAEKVLKAG